MAARTKKRRPSPSRAKRPLPTRTKRPSSPAPTNGRSSPAWTDERPLSFPPAVTDPYFAWALETSYRYLLQRGADDRNPDDYDRIPIIIELKDITAQEFALGKWDAPKGWEYWLRIPPLYLSPPDGLEHATYCT